MRYNAGTTDIPLAGTRVQISNTADRVKAISVQGRFANLGLVYFGVSDVASTKAWSLRPGQTKAISFGEGSVLFSVFYVDAANNGDDLDWDVVLE